MAIKKLRPVPAPLRMPEGIADLPLPALLVDGNTNDIMPNRAYENEFGNPALNPFKQKERLTLLKNRPVTLELFTQMGKHEGYTLKNKNEKLVPVSVRISRFPSAGESAYLVLFEGDQAKQELEEQLLAQHQELNRTLNELERTQSALIQSAKLASLGELSSGIAHELNQPLQAIMGFSQELAHFEKLSPQGSEFLSDIIQASKKMAEIIKSLRSFARDAGNEYGDTSILTCIHESTHLLQHALLQNNISIEMDLPKSIPLVYGNSIQIEQVLVNLLSNAKDAILEANRNAGIIKLSVREENEKVVLTVQDNGKGMNERTLQKIFDPFFTTKPVGKGTGLGLSLSYGMLTRMGGTISATSEPGTGSIFKVQFNKTKGETT